MICPRPGSSDNTAGHRAKGPRLTGCAQVNVNENTGEHDQRCNVMQHVAYRHRYSPGGFWEPHQQAGNQKQQSAEYNLPKLKLLAAVVEAYVFRFGGVIVLHISVDIAHPASIGFGPGHQPSPVEKLK